MNRTEIEAQLIGTWLGGNCAAFIDNFSKNDFLFFPVTFEKIQQAHRQGEQFSPITVNGEYKTSELVKVMSKGFPSLFEEHARQLRRIIATDELKNILHQAAQAETKDPYTAASDVITALREIRPTGPQHTSMMDLSLKYTEGFMAGWPTESALFYTGLPTIDKKMNGFRRNHLTTIASRTGGGKTSFAIQLTSKALQNDCKVLYVSREMDEMELYDRLFRHRTSLTAKEINEGYIFDTTGMSEEAVRKEQDRRATYFAESVDKLSTLPLAFDTKSRTIAEIRSAAVSSSADVVFIDYIGLLEETGHSIREKFVNITRSLKVMAQDLRICVVQLAQISRSAGDDIPTLSKLKESSSIEEDSNEVILLHHLTGKQACTFNMVFTEKDYEELEEQGKKYYTIQLAKNRAGETTGTIKAIFEASRFRLREAETTWKS